MQMQGSDFSGNLLLYGSRRFSSIVWITNVYFTQPGPFGVLTDEGAFLLATMYGTVYWSSGTFV